MCKVTTSWDDGDELDTRLAELLRKYGVKGTFYITKEYRSRRLSEEGMRAIATFHEIGAHTLTHKDLRTLSGIEKQKEIGGSKVWLENVLGKEVPMFCYPKGFFDDASVAIVKTAGFKGARTTKLASISPTHDPFRIDTTIQVYPFPFRKLDAKKYYFAKLFEPYRQRAAALTAIGVPFSAFRSWQTMARATFETAKAQGGTFHLWGHSWEIEKYGMWHELESFLNYMSTSDKEQVQFVTNNELF